MRWFIRALKKYTVFSGRARRQEYWMFYLFMMICFIVAGLVDNMFGDYFILTGLLGLFFFCPYISVTVRRLHDTGRSGWWIWIPLIPFIGELVFLFFMVRSGYSGENEYGPDPKDASFLSVK